jgi:hypothetical protein
VARHSAVFRRDSSLDARSDSQTAADLEKRFRSTVSRPGGRGALYKSSFGVVKYARLPGVTPKASRFRGIVDD